MPVAIDAGTLSLDNYIQTREYFDINHQVKGHDIKRTDLMLPVTDYTTGDREFVSIRRNKITIPTTARLPKNKYYFKLSIIDEVNEQVLKNVTLIIQWEVDLYDMVALH